MNTTFRNAFLLALTLFLVSLVLTVSRTQAQTHPTDTLTLPKLLELRHKRRVLLIFTPSLKESRYKQQTQIIAADSAGMEERDLSTFVISANPATPEGNKLRTRFDIPPNDFRVLLIGKDGHLAHSSPRPIVLRDLFERIDRMPMRQEEMRERGGG